MASESAKKHASYVYKIVCLIHWVSCIAMATLAGLAIHFAKGTSGYYGGALAVLALFNCQGIFIMISFGAAIAGIATGAAIGAQYGKNHNETDTSQDDDYINKEENRIIGTLIAVLSAIILVIMIRIICIHGEVRGLLHIPEKSNAPAPAAAPEPAPTPKPADQPQPGSSKSGDQNDRNFDREIEILTTQNNLLNEQNRLQKEQLELMAALNANLQQLCAAGQPRPVPPPPDYQSLDIISPTGYVFPDTGGPPSGDKK